MQFYTPITLHISDGYEKSEMLMVWKEPKPIEFDEDMYLSQFALRDISHQTECVKHYSMGRVFVISGKYTEYWNKLLVREIKFPFALLNKVLKFVTIVNVQPEIL